MFINSAQFLRTLSSLRYVVAAFALLSVAGISNANELTMAVNLGLSPEQAAQKYKPVLRYLGEATGRRIQLKVYASSLAHWEMMRRENFDMVLDNPAFTAYRAAKMNYTVIGKLPDVLSFTLVSNADDMMFEASELIGRKVASQPSPSITALRLDEIYSNPMQQPNFIKVDTHAEALELVRKKLVAGAIVPSGMLAGFQDLNPIYTTAQIPAPGLSVSARVKPEMRDTIRQALLDAPKSKAGRAMLKALNVPGFDAATNKTYAGLEKMLAGLYGF